MIQEKWFKNSNHEPTKSSPYTDYLIATVCSIILLVIFFGWRSISQSINTGTSLKRSSSKYRHASALNINKKELNRSDLIGNNLKESNHRLEINKENNSEI